MSIFLIWVIGVVCFGAYAVYRYGRTEERNRYAFDRDRGVIIFGILLWPIVLPLVVPIYFLIKLGKFFGKFFYELGEKHRKEK